MATLPVGILGVVLGGWLLVRAVLFWRERVAGLGSAPCRYGPAAFIPVASPSRARSGGG